MAQILHGCARTTEAMRREIQNSKESAEKLARRFNLNRKTVLKWKKRNYVHDAPMGPKNPRSTILTLEEEAAVVAFRKKTLLPLDDCLYALQETIPNLTRSSLYRCLKRHGINQLPQEQEDGKKKTKKFRNYPPGYIHIDITTVRSSEGKLYLFCAIDRNTKFVYARLYPTQTRNNALLFLKNVINTIPYKIQIILTDNGAQFAKPKSSKYVLIHPFDQMCKKHEIEHRLTKTYHPWTNGQVERMNRTLKEATVKKHHYKTHDQLKKHLAAFIHYYNFVQKLKALRGRTPYETVVDYWEENPQSFKERPTHHTMGLYN